MSIEMQRLLLEEIQKELSNIDRILNIDYCRVDDNTSNKLSKIHSILTTKDDSILGQTNN